MFEALTVVDRNPSRPWLELLDDEQWPTVLGADLRVDEPVPDDALIGHLRKRLNQLINANLRYAFGQ